MKVLFVFLMLEHRRREVLHFHVTEYPCAAWTSFNYMDVGPTTSGDFMEGQKTVRGKVSGTDDETSIFVVISLKVLDYPRKCNCFNNYGKMMNRGRFANLLTKLPGQCARFSAFSPRSSSLKRGKFSTAIWGLLRWRWQ
jgi:hypothetical protein